MRAPLASTLCRKASAFDHCHVALTVAKPLKLFQDRKIEWPVAGCYTAYTENRNERAENPRKSRLSHGAEFTKVPKIFEPRCR